MVDRPVVQLGLTWVVGSTGFGSAAAVALATPQRVGIPALSAMGPWRVTLLALLFAAVMVGLAMVVRSTPGASWLTDHFRGMVLWVLTVAVVGFAGWWYAATVTILAEFSVTAQLVLALLAGGLPFALVAGLLQHAWSTVTAAAVGASVAAVAGMLVVGAGPLVLVRDCLWLLVELLEPETFPALVGGVDKAPTP